jgi:transposase-like protein
MRARVADQPARASAPPHGCPGCAIARSAAARQGSFASGRSLAAVRPERAAELRDLDPNTLGPGSRTHAWWRCAECAHEWVTTIKHRVAAQLQPTRSGDLDPFTLGINTRHDTCWLCPECGHEWRTRVRGRASGTGCPRCARAHVSAATARQ